MSHVRNKIQTFNQVKSLIFYTYEIKVWILFKFGFLRKSKGLDFLRRSKATHMLLNGVSLPVIQRFLGHESIQTTEEYLEIGSEAMVQAVLQSSASVLTDKEMGEKPKWEDVDILERIRQKISTS